MAEVRPRAGIALHSGLRPWIAGLAIISIVAASLTSATKPAVSQELTNEVGFESSVIPPLCEVVETTPTQSPSSSLSELPPTEPAPTEPAQSNSGTIQSDFESESIDERTSTVESLGESAEPSPSLSPTTTPTATIAPTPSIAPTTTESASPTSTASPTPTQSPSPMILDPDYDCVKSAKDVSAIPGVNEVRLSWVNPAGVSAEVVYIEVSGPDDFSKVVQLSGDATSGLVSGLRNGVEYNFRIITAARSGSAPPTAWVSATPQTGMEGVVGGLIVQFTENVEVGQLDVPGEERVDSHDLTIGERVTDDSVLVELREPVDLATAEQIAADLVTDPAVQWAEPDQFLFTASAPMTEVSGAWNLTGEYGVDVDLSEADAGADVTVAVIDTGITVHPDIDSQVVAGYDFVSSPEQLSASRQANAPPAPFDADYSDTSAYGGVGRDANPADPGDWNSSRNSSWHGTHISGVITSVAQGAKIQPVRALSWRGGLLSDIAASITWASGGSVDGVPANSNPSKVINMSFAVETMCPTALQQAIDGASERGSLLVAAAGNASDDAAKFAPGNCNGVITVGASNRDGSRADYSNHGATIDISAPGGDASSPIYSASNTGTQTPDQPTTSGDFGTSIAAAHVSAAAAILASRNANLTPTSAYQQLTGGNFTKAFANPTCDANPDYTCGTGILSLAQVAAAGDTDTYVNLNGSNQNAVGPGGYYPVQGGSGQSFTVSAWVYDQDLNSSFYQYVMAQQAAGSSEAFFLGTRGGSQEIHMPAWDTGILIPLQQWVHLAVVRSGANATLYVNGAVAAVKNNYDSGVNISGNRPFRVGSFVDDRLGEFWNGRIDQVKVYTSVLSAAQVVTDMESYGAPSGVTSLVALYDFNDVSGSTIANRGTLGTTGNLTMANNPTYTNVATSSTSGTTTTVTFHRSYLTSNGGWMAPAGVSSGTALVVGGGGAGGFDGGGGGGGGGVWTGPVSLNAGSANAVTVGQGGAHRNGYNPNDWCRGGNFVGALGCAGNNGTTSMFASVGATGGGGGGGKNVGGSNAASSTTDGSGGGGGGNDATQQLGGTGRYNGGPGGATSDPARTMGGGGGGVNGAGAVGNGNNNTSAGRGGSGFTSSLSGSSLEYGAGGSGGAWVNCSYCITSMTGTGAGTGGWAANAATNGTPNQGGGGGGGGGGANAAGGYGGSGVVVLTYSTVPGAPTSVTATAGTLQASVSWNAPTYTGGSDVTSYTVTASPGGRTCTPSPSTSTSCTVTGLSAGTSYSFTVTATNANGTGPASSASNSVTPAASATKYGVTLSTSTPAAGGAVTVTAQLQDSSGNSVAVSGKIVTWSTNAVGGTFFSATSTTDSNGKATVVYTASETSGGGGGITATDNTSPTALTGTSSSFTVEPGTLAQLTAYSGAFQTAVMGSAVPVAPTVLAQDQYGNPVPGATIAFAVTAGGGSVASPGTGVTNASGFATSPTWTLGTTIGTNNNTLSASFGPIAVGFSASATSRSITITASSPSVTYPTVVTQSYSITSGALGGSDAIASMTYTYEGTSGTSYGPSTTAPTNVGTYSVTPSSAVFSAGNANNYTITYLPGTVTIAIGSQIITFNSISNVTYGAAPFSVSPVSTSGLAVTVVSSTPSVCTVSDNVVTIVGSAIGGATCSLTASQPGNTNYSAALDVTRTFTVSQKSQSTLTMSSASTAIYGQTITLAAIGGSGTGSLSFSVTSPIGPGLCSVSGSTLTLGNAGSLCKVQATKAASANYLIQTSAEQTITTTRAGQTVAFTSPVPTTPLALDTYTPIATANSTVTGSSSGVSTTFAVAGACTISAGIVTFTAGTCTITGSAAGNTNFNAAIDATQVIEVGLVNQNITFTQPATKTFGSSSFAAGATASSGLDVTYNLGSATTNSACSVSTLGVITILDIGTCEVTASQSGQTGVYAPASNVSRAFQIVAALPTSPTITSASASSQAITVGFTPPGFTGAPSEAIVAYQIVATPSPSGTLVTSTSCTSSPCTITGLTNGTAYTVTIAAINSAGTGPASTSSTALTPATAAFAVQNLSAAPGNTFVDVDWDQPVDLGGGTFVRYDLYFRAVGGSYGSATPITPITTTNYRVTGLNNGTSYDFKVVTITSANGSEFQGNTAEVIQYPSTVPTAPLTPIVLAATATEVQFSWSAPNSDGGAALTTPNYTVTVTGSAGATAVTCTPVGTATYCTTTPALSNDATYTFSVVANNRMGSSVPATFTYNVPSSNADLANLTAASGSTPVGLSPTFASSTTAYSASVSNNEGSVTVTPTTTMSGSTVKVNGITVASGTASGPIALSVGSNTISILVTASDPRSTKTYTIVITRAAAPSPGGGVNDRGAATRVPIAPGSDVMAGSQPVAVVLDGARESDIAVTANSTNSGWTVSAPPDFRISVRTESSSRVPEPLNSQGVMQVPQGGFVVVNATDYLPDSTINVFAIPRTQGIATTRGGSWTANSAVTNLSNSFYLGSASVDASGNVVATFTVTAEVDLGSYVLQVNGLTPSEQVRSVDMLMDVVAGALDMRSGSMRESAFYKGVSSKFTKTGRAKLLSLVNSIPAGAEGVQVVVVGVSTSAPTVEENIDLARDRAKRIASFMKAQGVKGKYTITISTTFYVDGRERTLNIDESGKSALDRGETSAISPNSAVGLDQPAQSSKGKPLTTASVSYSAPAF